MGTKNDQQIIQLKTKAIYKKANKIGKFLTIYEQILFQQIG